MATIVEIGVELERLSDALPAPRGVKPDKAFQAYCDALVGFSGADITAAVTRFFSGEFAKDVSSKFYPKAPELAMLVRKVAAERQAAEQRERHRLRVLAERDEDESFVPDSAEAKERVQQLLARAGFQPWPGTGAARTLGDQIPEKPPARKIPDYSQDKIAITPALDRVMQDKRQSAAQDQWDALQAEAKAQEMNETER